jgi:prophage regulatory protein
MLKSSGQKTTLTHEPSAPVALAAVVDKSAVPADAVLLSMAQIETLIGLNRTRVYKWLREGLFPSPIKLGKTSRWHRAEVEHWLTNLAESRTLKEAVGGAA